MDKNLEQLFSKKVEKVVKSLEKNGINATYLKTKSEIVPFLKEKIEKKSSITVGGSMTLFETGVIDFLRTGDFEFYDRYKSGISIEEIEDIYLKAFQVDYYLSSSNAITENGELYNVDGRGNRVSAIIYGPKKVFIIVGINKIVKDIDAAIKRNEEIAAPANTIRLNKKTPCATIGYCINCESPDRICNVYTIIGKQNIKNRIEVIIIGENLGY
ncbi:lactate utilization protein [bacterium]|nr:lactate utilization protein [bacterium]